MGADRAKRAKELVADFPEGATVVEEFPAGATAVQSFPENASPVTEKPSIPERVFQRFLGTDVDDPMVGTRLGTIVAGSVAGGITGLKIGTAAGAATGPAAPFAIPALGTAGLLIGSGMGAFGGAGAPEGILEIGERLDLLEKGTREREGLSPEELKTVTEGEALLDLATGGGLTVLRAGGRASAKVLTGARKELADVAAKHGIDMMPVQVGDRVIARGFVAVFGRFPFLGGGAIRRAGLKAERQFQDVASGLTDRVGPVVDSSDLGTTIFGDAKALVRQTNKYFNSKYTEIFERADEFGITVAPKNTVAKADEILAKLRAQTPVTVTGEATTPGPALQKVREFIEREVLPLSGRTPITTKIKLLAKQSLRQMDGLISKIDQEIAATEPSQKRFALSLLNQLRQAAQSDIFANARGQNADEIARALKALDAEFSGTMQQLFETATAKRFGSVERRGLRALEFDRTTRIPVDQLSRIVVNLDSPQAIEELSRLVTPETMRRIAAQTIDDAMQLAMKQEGFVGKFDVAVFARKLGLEGPRAARRRVIDTMLKKSGSNLTIEDLDTIVEVGRALESLEIPNVSSFIARRGTIGGLQSILNGVIPGMALMGGSAAVAWNAGSFLGTVFFVGGSHLFARIISNPNSARALHVVFDKEASQVIRRKAFISGIRLGIDEMKKEGEITELKASQLLSVLGLAVEAFDKQVESLRLEQGENQ